MTGTSVVDRTVNWLRSDRFGVSWVGGRTAERHEEALIEELGARAWVRLEGPSEIRMTGLARPRHRPRRAVPHDDRAMGLT